MTDAAHATVRGGTLIAEVIRAESVPFVAGVVGGSLHEIVDGFVGMPEVRSILTRHERVASDMADGYARTTGRVGVALAVQGPGATNAIAGVANSYKDSVPVLQILGQVRQSVLGTDTAQELPLAEIFAPVTKWTATIPTVERVTETFRRAFTMLRSGRPRPVAIVIPTDVSAAYIERSSAHYEPVQLRYRSAGDPAEIERAAKILATASRPVLYAGAGVLAAEAWDELRELAELIAAPVMSTLNAKGVLPEDHPLSLGLGGFPVGLFASKQAVHFARGADAVLAIGNSFKPSATRGAAQPSDVRLIHVDTDATELNKIYVPEVGIVGDAKLVLRGLIDAIGTGGRARTASRLRVDVVSEIARVKREWLDEWKPMLESGRTPINPYRLTWDINRTVDRHNTIIMHDSGSVRGYLCHHYEAIEPRSFLGFGGMSSMGWTTGAALGAKLGNPDKTVINFIGDGSFGMTGMDFQTAVRHGIAVLTIVVNNGVLNMSMETRRQNFGERYGDWIHLGDSDYAGVARALGGWAERVTEPDGIVSALERALAETRGGRPALLEVIVEPLIPEPILADPRGEANTRLIARPSTVPQG